RRVAIWGDASHVPEAAHRARRADRPGAVVGVTVHDAGPSESFAGEPHRLVLVHGFPVRLRRRRGRCRNTAVAYADSRERVFRPARRNRGSRYDSASRKRGGTSVNAFRHLSVFAALGATLLWGCGSPHGQPRKGSETLAPNEVLEFGTLYAENCGGCHGEAGRGGAAIALANPVYLAVADEAAVRRVIASGVRGTAMPAFAESAGGMLTDKQIDVITSEIRSRWSRRGILDGANPPSYASKSTGDARRGEAVF